MVAERSYRTAALAGILVLLAETLAGAVHAQPRRLGSGLEHGVSGGLAIVDFAPNDPDTPAYFRFSALAPVLAYNQPGMHAEVVYATDDGTVDGESADLDMLDVSLLLHGDLTPFEPAGRLRFEPFIPIALVSSYRRLRNREDASTLTVFEYQRLGIGTGAGARARDRRWFAEAHAIPSVAFATRSFGSSTGIVYGLSTGARLGIGPVVGRFGVEVGYGFTWQRWRVGGPEAVSIAGSGRYNFTGNTHVVRIGLSW